MNSDDGSKAFFQIELKLRYLVKDVDSLTKIFAIYDCCRVDVAHIPGIAGGRGADSHISDDDSEEQEVCKYFHLQACAPGGIADADGGFAKKIFDRATRFSTKEPKGFISCPSDWLKAKWSPGEIHVLGGEPYLLPFNDNSMHNNSSG